VVARNEAGDWYVVVAGGAQAWIASLLVENVSGDLPVRQSDNSTGVSASMHQVGEEFEGNGWRLKVREVHKRKAVYLDDSSAVASGHWLIVILDAVNLQPGADYPQRRLLPWVTELDPANIYQASAQGSSYAQWQYEGLSSELTEVEPGALTRVALAYDLPDDVGNVYFSTAIPAWVYLGNFSAMPTED
jgi:hypothetical protein